MTRLKPIGSNVLVRLDARAEQSKGGIAIPAVAQKAEQWGEVIAVGKEVEALAPGERAYVSPYAGTHYIEDGVDYIIIPEAKVVAKQEATTSDA